VNDSGVEQKATLARVLTAKDGFTIVAGSVIGSGIFLVPGPIAVQLVSLRSVLLVWLTGALLSIFGALSLAELGSMFPGAGGLYIYLRRAYGKVTAFLYGWGLLSMIQTGSIATLGAGFGLYLSRIVSMTPMEQKAVSAGSILVLTGINLPGVRTAKYFQNVSTAAKLAGLFLLGALLFRYGRFATLSAGWNASSSDASSWGFHEMLPFGVALIAVLWAYEGWHVVSFTAGEFRNPGRDLPLSLICGTVAVGAIYLVLNVAYYSVLPPALMRGLPSAAATAMSVAYGGSATRLVSLLILVSIFGAMNGMILTGPRVYYAMARDGDFLAVLGKIGARSRVPAVAIVTQGIWAAALTLTGSFQMLFTYVIFTAWIFYGLTVAAVIVLRRRFPDSARPFRTPGYPLVPILFVMASAAVVISTVLSQPVNALIGIGLILLGLPVYLLFSFQQRRAAGSGATPGMETTK
jgi:APA family basic amino acid/polyamine antiporter